MTKVLNANCEAGQVTCEGLDITAQILSLGQKSSSGCVVISDGRVYYFASSAPDILEVLEKLDDVFQKTIAVLINLDAVTTTPSSASALISELTSLVADLEEKQGDLI